MNRPFPIFVDLATVPPLVIGNADILAAKLRLVLKFAPLKELITDRPVSSHLLVNLAVRQLTGVTCNAAADQIKGRPLVIIETFDPQLNAELARQLRQALPAPHPIVAAGHIIPDQADFLFRSGFSHAMINPLAVAAWQTALGMVSTRFQHMPNSPRTR